MLISVRTVVAMADRSSSSIPSLLGGAVATGVATALVAPMKMSLMARRSLHVGLGLTMAAAVAHAVGQPDTSGPDVAEPVPPLRTRVAMGAGLGSLCALGSAAGMGLDMSVEKALVRRGVRHPRWWIGAGAAALTAAMSWVEPRVATREESAVRA